MLLQDGGDGDVGAVPGDQCGGAAQRVRGAHEQHHDHHQRGTMFNNFNIDVYKHLQCLHNFLEGMHSGRISSVYIVGRWSLVTLFLKL